MASFIEHEKKDYMIVKEGPFPILYHLNWVTNPSEELLQAIKENESDIIADLFLSDYQERGSKAVAADLGMDHKWVQMSIHYLKEGRKMTHAKIQKLKKIYSVDRLMKE